MRVEDRGEHRPCPLQGGEGKKSLGKFQCLFNMLTMPSNKCHPSVALENNFSLHRDGARRERQRTRLKDTTPWHWGVRTTLTACV